MTEQEITAELRTLADKVALEFETELDAKLGPEAVDIVYRQEVTFTGPEAIRAVFEPAKASIRRFLKDWPKPVEFRGELVSGGNPVIYHVRSGISHRPLPDMKVYSVQSVRGVAKVDVVARWEDRILNNEISIIIGCSLKPVEV